MLTAQIANNSTNCIAGIHKFLEGRNCGSFWCGCVPGTGREHGSSKPVSGCFAGGWERDLNSSLKQCSHTFIFK